jgi:hypothetical protein
MQKRLHGRIDELEKEKTHLSHSLLEAEKHHIYLEKMNDQQHLILENFKTQFIRACEEIIVSDPLTPLQKWVRRALFYAGKNPYISSPIDASTD